jgi:hypothetical protein
MITGLCFESVKKKKSIKCGFLGKIIFFLLSFSFSSLEIEKRKKWLLDKISFHYSFDKNFKNKNCCKNFYLFGINFYKKITLKSGTVNLKEIKIKQLKIC